MTRRWLIRGVVVAGLAIAGAARAAYDGEACGQRSIGGINGGVPLGLGVRFGRAFGYDEGAPDYRLAILVDVGFAGAKLSVANYLVLSEIYCVPRRQADGRIYYVGANEVSWWRNLGFSLDLAATYSWADARTRRELFLGPELSVLTFRDFLEFMAPGRVYVGVAFRVLGRSDTYAVLPTAGIGISW
jgi:hypothetical protein